MPAFAAPAFQRIYFPLLGAAGEVKSCTWILTTNHARYVGENQRPFFVGALDCIFTRCGVSVSSAKRKYLENSDPFHEIGIVSSFLCNGFVSLRD